jgi:hypothetical protein
MWIVRLALRRASLFFLAALPAALVGVVGELWLAPPARRVLVLVPVVALALVGAVANIWAGHARTTRHLAILDAYAEREIVRSRPTTERSWERW